MFEERIKKLPAYALGFNTLLIGNAGCGKTTSLATLVKSGLEVFALFSEANGQTNFLKALREAGVTEEEMKRVHFKYIKSGNTGFKVLGDAATKVLNAPEFGKIEGGSRSKYDQLVQLMKACQSFVDQNGVDFGAVDSWGADRVVCLDSLTGLNDMAMSLTIGGKPCATQQDWQVAMKQEMDLVKTFIGVQCSFVMTAHLSLEKDEVSGRLIQVPMALGQKNGPALVPLFGDIVLCEKNDKQFTWSTTSAKTDCLKNSFLPLKSGLKPDFVQIVDNWLKDNGC